MSKSIKFSLAAIALVVLCLLLIDHAAPMREAPAAGTDAVTAPATTHAAATPAVPATLETSAGTSNDVKATAGGGLHLVHWPQFKYPHVIQATDPGPAAAWVATHVLATLREGVDPLQLAAALEGAQTCRIERLTDATWRIAWTGASLERFLREEQEWTLRLDGLAVVERDPVIRAFAKPDDPLLASQYYPAAIDAAGGWDMRTDAGDVVVAILDSGIEAGHPDLAANLYRNPGEVAGNRRDDDGNGFVDDLHGWDFVDNDADPADSFGHGTGMAGIIGATANNQTGYAGIAWRVQLLPLRFLNDEGIGVMSDELAALDYIIGQGVHVVNASFGHTGYSYAEELQYRKLQEAGIRVVAAAGNDGSDSANLPSYPACLDLPNIISVGASTATDTRALFSNYGKSVDLFAPGAGIGMPALGGGYTTASGTSPAAAIVSGAVALLLAEYPESTTADLNNRLFDRSRYSPALAGLSAGAGILSIEHALAPQPKSGPVIVEPPQGGEFEQGTEVILNVVVRCYGAQKIAWFRDGVLIPGATGPQLRILLDRPSQEGAYHAEIRDAFGLSTTQPVMVHTPPVLPRIDSVSTAGYLVEGMPLVLVVTASGSQPLAYEWFHDGQPVPGATTARLERNPATAAMTGTYTVRVSNRFGSVESGPIAVQLAANGELQWFPIQYGAPSPVCRVGDYYYSNDDRYSEDLFIWRKRDPAQGSIPLFVDGVYWCLSLNAGELLRSTDGIRWDAFAALPSNAYGELVIGNGYALVVGPAMYRINLMNGTVIRLPFDDYEQPYFHDGVFEVRAPDKTVMQSVDGTAWEAVPSARPLVVHIDPASGKYVGYAYSYSSPSNRYFISNDLVEWREIPQNFKNPVFFAAGRIFSKVASFDIGSEAISWQANGPGSYLIYEDAGWRCAVEDGVTRLYDLGAGTTSELILPQVIAPPAGHSFGYFVIGGRMFISYGYRVFSVSDTGRCTEVMNVNNLTRLVATDTFALFENSLSKQLFRMSPEGEFSLLAPNLPADHFTSIRLLGSLLCVYANEGLWISANGESWELYPRSPAGAAKGSQNIVIAVDFQNTSEQTTVQVYRLNQVTRIWEPVTSWQGPRVSQSYQNAAGTSLGFLIQNGEEKLFSTDGIHWQDSFFTSITSISILKEVGNTLVNSSSKSGEASFDGINWFAIDVNNWPLAISPTIALNTSAIARTDGLPFRADPVILLQGSRALRVPAKWQMTVLPSEPDAVERIEIIDQGAVVASASTAGAAAFELVKDLPGALNPSVRIHYADGWILQTEPVACMATADLEESVMRVTGYQPPPVGDFGMDYFQLPEGFYAKDILTSVYFYSPDGSQWQPAPEGAIPNVFGLKFQQLASGATVNLPILHPFATYAGHLREPGGVAWQELPLPDPALQMQFISFVWQGNLHFLYANGAHYLWEAGSWRPLPYLGWLAANYDGSPYGQPVKVHLDLSNDNLILLQTSGKLAVSSDLESCTELQDAALWKHLGGLWFQKLDAPVTGVVADTSGTIHPVELAPVSLKSLNWIDEKVFFATDNSGILWTGRRGASPVPVTQAGLAPRAVYRNSTQLLLFFGDGSIRSFPGHDFSITSCQVVDVDYGGQNILHAVFNLQHKGILSPREGGHLTIGASLQPLADGDAVVLESLSVPIGTLSPGDTRGYAVDFKVPSHLNLGDYRLILMADPGNEITEASESNNQAASAEFAYNPMVSLLLATRGKGWINSSQFSSQLPYGTDLALSAVEFDGHTFLGWSGTIASASKSLALRMENTTRLTAHFIADHLLALFPEIQVAGDEARYAVPPGPYAWVLNDDWIHLEDWGWAYVQALSPLDFYVADAGWFHRIPGTPVYFHYGSQAWFRYDPAALALVPLD